MSQNEYVSWPTKSVVTTLSSAQLKALMGTPVTLIAAPGAGKAIIPVVATFLYRHNTAPYGTISNTGSIAVGFTDGNVAVNLSDQILSKTADQFAFAPLTISGFDALTVFENQPVTIQNTGGADWTAGDGTLTIAIYYVIAPLP